MVKNPSTKRAGNPTANFVFAFLAILLCLGQSLCAQMASDASEIFRQASEAMRRGDLNAAGDGFAAAAKVEPTFAEAHFNLGLVREEQGRLEDAVASLKKALALNPRLRGANLFLGIAHFRLNQYEPAIAALRIEIKLNPADPKAWMWLGVAELARERPEEAVIALDKAAKLAPGDADILYHRGHAHLLVSKLSYERMLRVEPDSWHVRQVLAQADAEADRDADAVSEYQAAIKAAPQQPGLHEELGSEYWKISKLEEAEAEFEQELAIDPHSLLATYKLGSLFVEGARPMEGKPLIEAALRQDPNLKEAYYYLGRAHMQLGNENEALEALKKAVTITSNPELLAQAWYQLAIVYRRMHRMEEAQQALATFQKLKDQESEHRQKRLEKKLEKQNAQ
jgi:tetratricopeptide (TPR) repeat protein